MEINQSYKRIPELAKIFFPLGSLLKNDNNRDNKEHEKAFEQIKREIKIVTILNHIETDYTLRIHCEVIQVELEAVLH